MIEEAKYAKALALLKKTLQDPALPAETRPLVLARLGLFYQNRVGDIDRAKGYFNKIGRHRPAAGHPAATTAEAALTRLAALAEKFADADEELVRLKRVMLRPGALNSPESRAEVQAAIAHLKRIARQKQAYHRLHEVFFHIGMGQLALGRHWRALAAFDQAVALKPAMHLYQPVQRLSRTAREAGWRALLSTGAWGFSAIFGAILMLAASLSKPWRWVTFRHLGIGSLVLLLWWGGFQLTFFWIGKHSDAADIVNRDNFYPAPTYVHTLPGAPGSEAVKTLFRYGSVAVAGIYLLAVCTARLRRRVAALALNLGLSILLSLSLTTIFYLRHCEIRSRLYVHEESLGGLLTGHLAFRLSDPEPYLLTHPTYYRGLELDSIYDPELLEWLERYQ